ncbi:hypothetical protein [Halostreptopolyspora alba]|uniref:Uncharacterized protein n=1 Tax=Halostreptopolyspora alba TaxID=2487137 RepID=A0A3N0E1M6_9ACTN|nr:hypothetical protein EFW17_21550 [Nocardiopsaceae bacterium YIM 96095]
MAWSWRYETADGRVLDDETLSLTLPGELFPSRGDAESWLGESWRELVEAGADRVTLLEDDRVVYTMGLHEE